ncbi:potassium channel subfamily K member 17-like [Peromyscus eremicus]|uniref:potassium channel subfamily K member 17-like n=1 Tax=Peromyscus eremicus TaxID=42410 RepID=UPI0027DC7354|nr:potassium channel subfamily K member 17-like [Peromyscus eremicus]
MVQQVKVFAANPDGLSLIYRTPLRRKKADSCKQSSDPHSLSITCRLRSPAAPWWAGACGVRGTGLLLLSYLAYLVLATGVFWALEGRTARDPSRSFQGHKWELLHNYTSVDGPALDLLVRDVIQAYKDETSLLGTNTSLGCWEFVGSFFFSVSTITTIGYGNLSLQTMAAQSLRLFYRFFALLGILLLNLNRLGHLMWQCYPPLTSPFPRNGQFSKVPSVEQEYRVLVDSVLDGLAGSDQQTDPIPV